MPAFTETLIDELKRFVRSNRKAPAIEGPPELQDALEDLCVLIIRNAGPRGVKARAQKMKRAALLNKDWYPEELIKSTDNQVLNGEHAFVGTVPHEV